MSTRGLLMMAASLACGGGDDTTGPDGPTPDLLTVALTTPNTDDEAILLPLAGRT